MDLYGIAGGQFKDFVKYEWDGAFEADSYVRMGPGVPRQKIEKSFSTNGAF